MSKRRYTGPRYIGAGSFVVASPSPAVTTTVAPLRLTDLVKNVPANARLSDLVKDVAEANDLRKRLDDAHFLAKVQLARISKLEADLALYKQQPSRTRSVSKMIRNADGTHTAFSTRWRGPEDGPFPTEIEDTTP